MADYFVSGNSGAATVGTTAPTAATAGATNGDVGMDDDVLVSSFSTTFSLYIFPFSWYGG